MNKNQKLIIFITALIFSFLFFLFIGKEYTKYLKITYSEFKVLAKERLVDNLVIKKYEIFGKFKKGAGEKLYQLRQKPVRLTPFLRLTNL